MGVEMHEIGCRGEILKLTQLFASEVLRVIRLSLCLLERNERIYLPSKRCVIQLPRSYVTTPLLIQLISNCSFGKNK